MGVFNTLRSVVRFRTFERDRTLRTLTKVADVGDLRTLAKKRLPAGCFDYIDGAAQDEVTAAANVSAFTKYSFRPRVLRDVSSIETSTAVSYTHLTLPTIYSV